MSAGEQKFSQMRLTTVSREGMQLQRWHIGFPAALQVTCFCVGHTAGFCFLPFTSHIALLIVLLAERSLLLTQLAGRQAVHLYLIR